MDKEKVLTQLEEIGFVLEEAGEYGYFFRFEGLMTADGHIVTLPLYKDIEAIGYDLYLCEVSNNDKVIVNGKGEIMK